MPLHLRFLIVIAVTLTAILPATATRGRVHFGVAADGATRYARVPLRMVAEAGPRVEDIDVVSVTESYVYTCGIASCSYYINRRGTKAAAEYISRHENVLNAGAATVAAGACAATGAGVAAVTVCTGAGSAAAGLMMDEVKAAGDSGDCLRLHYFHYPVLLPATPAADASGYCLNG